MNLRTIWGNALPMGALLHGGKYRIDWLLGRGGFGITYRATHTVLGRVVAIKEFFPRDFVHRNVGETPVSIMPVSQTDYERGLDRFLREGQVLSQIKEDHIVRVEDFFRDNNTAYLVMELLDGRSLRAELGSAGGKLPTTRVFQVVEDLVQALTVTHAQSVWHCDIKPDNIQILPSGRAVLIDFGAAHQGLASQSTRAFTRDYAAPELETGKPVDARTDLFELGMVIHEMVTGRRPPMAVDRMMRDTWNPAHLRNPWKSWLPPLLQMRPEQRPDSVAAWWKKRPKSLPAQLPLIPPVQAPVTTSATTAPPIPTSFQSQAPVNVPGPLRPAPRINPGQPITPGSPRQVAPRPATGRLRISMGALVVLAPLTVLLMTGVGILSGRNRSYNYSDSPHFGGAPATSVPKVVSGPERATEMLEQVIREGQGEGAFRTCVKKGASLLKDDYRDSQGNALTPLLFAIKKYDSGDVVRFLASKGARINIRNTKGETPLHYAATLGRRSPGDALIKAGANVNAKDDNGWTPLHVCGKYGQKYMVSLFTIARANVNARSNYGGTPLHVAAFYDQAGTAEALIGKGADVNAKDNDGGTPLNIAVHFDKESMADLLVAKKANVNIANDSGDTPLHVAIREGHFRLVRLLLDSGADVNARNKQGETSFHLIVRTGQQGLTQQMLDKGADVNIQNNDGETSLHLAARRDNVDLVKLLLDKNAQINATSASGETPLHLAAEAGQRGIVELLLSRGANPNIQDTSGQTPLQKAKDSATSSLLEPGGPNDNSEGNTPVNDEGGTEGDQGESRPY